MSVEVIELRQKDGLTPDDTQPAEFAVKLQKPVQVNDGDAVSVKAAFIDTEASSEQKLVIADDLQLNFQCGYYQNLVRDDAMDVTNGGADGYANGPAAYVDGKTYVLMKTEGAAGFYLEGLTFTNTEEDGNNTTPDPAFDGNTGMGDPWYVQYLVTFQYYNPAGTLVSTTVDMSKQFWERTGGTNNYNTTADVTQIIYDKTKSVPGKDANTPVAITNIQTGNWGPSQPGPPNNQGAGGENHYWSNGTATFFFHDKDGNHLKFDLKFLGDTTNPPNAAAAQVSPYITDSQLLGYDPIIVPKGDYTPLDLTTVINRQLQRDNPPANSLLQSQFLLQYNPAKAAYTNTLWIAEDRSAAFKTSNPLPANVNGGLLIGATNMVLDYDEDRKTFFWSYIHSPYLGAPNQSLYTESVGFIKKQNLVAGTGDSVLVRRQSGVYFTGLSANKVGTTESVAFWDEMLGFNLGDLLASITDYGNNPIKGLAIPDLKMPPEIPVNSKTTAGYAGLDILANRVVPQAGGDPGWWHMPVLSAGTDGTYFSTSNGITEEIFASKSILTRTDSFGYFLLDIAAKYGQEFVGANDQFRSIRGIVSRYYENDSYTAASEADGIGYIHKGDPLLLDSFRVRILQSNKLLAENLGNDNSVFLQVQRPE